MDIKKELKKLTSSKNLGQDIVDNMKHEISELMEKAYLFQIIVIANKIEDAVTKELFGKAKTINIEMGYADINYKVEWSLFDKDNVYIDEETRNGRPTKQATFLNDLFENIEGFSEEQVNPKLKQSVTLELKQGIKEEILDLFLSKKLKAVLEYSKMELDLPENSGDKTKKPKM